MKWSIFWAVLFFVILAVYGMAPDAWRNLNFETLGQLQAAALASSGYAAVSFDRIVDKTTLAILGVYCWGLAAADWAIPHFPGSAMLCVAVLFCAWMLYARWKAGHWLGLEAARNGLRRVADVLRGTGR